MAIKTPTKLAVPKEPNVINVCPALSTWPLCALRNRDILTTHSSVLHEYRNELLSLAVAYTKDLTEKKITYDLLKPVIATGHQPNWHHCGIFVKSLLGHQLAKRLNGLFIHVVVDHDISDTRLVLPVKETTDLFDLISLTFNDNDPGIPLEGIHPDPKTVRDFLVQSVKASPQCALLKNFWDVIHLNNFFKKNRSASDCVTYLQDIIYQSLNIDAIYLPISRISESKVFQVFFVYLLSNFICFFDYYNKAVSISKTHSGIPKLRMKTFQTHSFTELPLWLLTPKNNRTSLFLSSDSDNKIMLASESEILVNVEKTDLNLVPMILKQKGYSLRPKAVLLTLFLRLYLGDWFIHGVGGAKYELISDYLLKHLFRIKGLSYGSATLTSYLFDKERAVTRKTLDRLQVQHRALLHSPESLLNLDQKHESELCDLLEKKQDAILCSNDSGFCSQKRNDARQEIRAVNRELQAYLPFSEESILEEISKLKEQLAIFQKRDFFFGLFSQEYLNSFSEETNEELQ